MECRDVDRLLVRRSVAALKPDEEAALDAHLADCEDCRDAADLLGAAPDAGHDLPRVASSVFHREGLLGEGGMGTTHLAVDERLGRRVALKRPRQFDSPERDRELLVRFEREARMTARLQHPAIVSVYEAGYLVEDDREELYYTMQPVDGEQLQVEIERRPELARRLELLPHITTIANAVAYAHDRGVVHRDIKPANILIGKFGEAVLIDWGLATQLDEVATAVDEEARGTLTRMGVGTVCYMPPEQAGGGGADPRLDVYALGATLYHVLAGTPPYGERATRGMLLAEPPTALAAIDPKIPPELTSIVSKAMARDSAERFATARELADELARYQSGKLVQSHRHRMRDLAWRWIRRHRAAVTAALLAIAAVVAIGVYSLTRVLAERRTALAARSRAVAAADQATAVLGRSLLARASADLASGRPLTAANLLDRVRRLGDDRAAVRLTLAWALDRAGRRWSARKKVGVHMVAIATAPGDEIVVTTANQAMVLAPNLDLRAARSIANALPAISPATGDIVLATDGDHAMVTSPRLSELAALRVAPRHRKLGATYTVADVSRDGRHAAAGDNTGHVSIWSLPSGTLERELAIGSPVVDALAFGPDDRLATYGRGSFDGAIWALDRPQPVVALKPVSDAKMMTFSHDGSRLISAGSVGLIEWPAAGGTATRGLQLADSTANTASIQAVFSGDDQILADARSGRVYLWSADSWRLIDVIDTGSYAVAFTPSGKLVTAEDRSENLLVWPVVSDPATSVDLETVMSSDVARTGGTVAVLTLTGARRYDLSAGTSYDIPLDDGRFVAQSDDGCVLAAIDGNQLELYATCRGNPVLIKTCPVPDAIGDPKRITFTEQMDPSVYGTTGWTQPCADGVPHAWCDGCKAFPRHRWRWSITRTARDRARGHHPRRDDRCGSGIRRRL